MSRAPSEYTRLFLRHVRWESARLGRDARSLLKDYATGKIQETASGLSVVSVSADGVATTYGMPAPSAGMVLSPEALASMISVIWDQIDALDAANTPDLEGDALIAALLANNQPIRTLRTGFHLMNLR